MTGTNGNRWAVLLGACKYERHTPLQYATVDAVEFASALETLGFERERMLLLADADEAHAQPTRRDLFDALGLLSEAHSPYFSDHQVDSIAKDDLFLFYFSGHGLRTKGGREFLLPVEASQYSVVHTAIALEDVVSEIERLPCDHKVLFIDACREEFDRDDGAKAVSGTKGIGEPAVVDRAGLATFYSCDPKDRSYEIDKFKHGSFTYCLLEAIKHPGINTLEELDGYLKSRVPQVNVDAGKTAQQPFVVSNPVDMLQIDLFRLAVIGGDPERQHLKILTNQLDGEGRIDDDMWDKAMQAWENLNTPNFRRKKILFEQFARKEIDLEGFRKKWSYTDYAASPATPGTPVSAEPPVALVTSGNGHSVGAGGDVGE